MNHGVGPGESREVGTTWESLGLGFAADDTALKLCIEKRPDSSVEWHVAPPCISLKISQLFCVYLAKLCSSAYLGL